VDHRLRKFCYCWDQAQGSWNPLCSDCYYLCGVISDVLKSFIILQGSVLYTACISRMHSLRPVVIIRLQTLTWIICSYCGDGIDNFGTLGVLDVGADVVEVTFYSLIADGAQSGIRIKFEAVGMLLVICWFGYTHNLPKTVHQWPDPLVTEFQRTHRKDSEKGAQNGDWSCRGVRHALTQPWLWWVPDFPFPSWSLFGPV